VPFLNQSAFKQGTLKKLITRSRKYKDFLDRDVLEAMQVDSRMELTSLQVDGGKNFEKISF